MFSRQAWIVMFLLIVVAVPTTSRCQVPVHPPVWAWTQTSEHHDPIMKVGLDGAEGTGVIVHVDRSRPSADGFLGYGLTAHHVVRKDNGRGAITVDYRNGRHAHRGRVVSHDEENDLAVLWVWVPASVVPAKIASQSARYGDSLELAGLGGRAGVECCLRHFSAKAAVTTNEEKIYADVALLPGDSGGPIFNAQRELVGIISGGWFWFHPTEPPVANPAGMHTTWPARACNTGSILKLLKNPAGCTGDGCDEQLAELAQTMAR